MKLTEIYEKIAINKRIGSSKIIAKYQKVINSKNLAKTIVND